VAAIFILLWLLVSVGVYLDARRNSPQSAVLWALAVFFGVIGTLFVYILLGRDAARDAEYWSRQRRE
jgi:cytochrome c-type biogenesis protein CcmH/NrfF